jgi:branched-chain amino acid transport system ATP-binding protein
MALSVIKMLFLPMHTVIEVQHLAKSYGPLKAVKDVSFDVVEGEIFGLLGPNGAGKSTYFNLVTGYHRPTSGKVLFRGKEITNLPAYHRCNLGITRSFQITSIYPKLTVYESVLMALLSHRKVTLNFLLLQRNFLEKMFFMQDLSFLSR